MIYRLEISVKGKRFTLLFDKEETANSVWSTISGLLNEEGKKVVSFKAFQDRVYSESSAINEILEGLGLKNNGRKSQ